MTVLTIGHSNHDRERFAELVASADIEVIADVRTAPFSQYTPHFNQDPLKRSLAESKVGYVFLGRELGGRPTGGDFYDDEGHVFYDKVAATDLFRAGMDRLLAGAETHRVALMCGEGHPSECHRHLLVARVLVEEGVKVEHLLADGDTLDASELLQSQRPEPTLFGQEEMSWRSIRLVLPNTPQRTSSES